MKTSAQRLFCAILISCATNLIAQEAPIDNTKAKEQRQMALQALRESMNVFLDREVIPQIQEWKTSIEQNLSATDLQTLQQLRRDYEQLRQRQLNVMSQFYEAHRNNQPEETLNGLRATLKTLRAEGQQISKAVGELVDQNPILFNKISADAREKKSTWRTYVQSLNVSANVGFKGNTTDHASRFFNHTTFRRVPFTLNNVLETPQSLKRFLFWPGVPPKGNIAIKSPIIHDVSIYPNPTRDFTKVRFRADLDEEISVTLHNAQGGEVRKMIHKLPAGTHTLDLNTDGLDNGVYVCKISTHRGSEVRQIVINR